MTIEELQTRLTQWHLAKHGRTEPDMVRTALKGCEEMGEIAKATLKGDNTNLAEEVADVFIILLHLCRGLNIDLLATAKSKLQVIEQRLKRQQKL